MGNDKAKVLTLNLRNRLIFRAADEADAVQAADFLGKKRVVKRSWGYSTGRTNSNYSETEEHKIKPHKLRNLRDHECVLVHCEGACGSPLIRAVWKTLRQCAFASFRRDVLSKNKFTCLALSWRLLGQKTIRNMTIASITSLRKTKKKTGELYTRFPEITAKLTEMMGLPRDKVAELCANSDPESSGYVPSECLLHLVRERRSYAFDEHSEALFKALMGRVLRGLPKAENWDDTRERKTDGNVRDEGRHRFLTMLMKDRQEYFDGLDIYEVRFEMALQKLRFDAQRKVYRKDDPLESIEIDHETGEIAAEVEQAAGNFNPFDSEALANSDYLLRLEQTIDGLPAMEKAVVVMIRNEIPIESKEPDVVNISKTLGKTPKTIRKYRDQAYASMRAALLKGETR